MSTIAQDVILNTPEAPQRKVGRPAKYNPHMLRKAKEYVGGKYKKIPTIAGLCVHLGISRQALYVWLKDESKQELIDTVSLMPEIREDLLIQNSLESKWNSNIAKLILTTNHGYSENNQQDTGITINIDRGCGDSVTVSKEDQSITIDADS